MEDRINEVLQHVVPPTDTTLKPTLLETQAGTQYTNIYVMTTSYLKSIVTFLAPDKYWKSSFAPKWQFL